MPGSYSVSVVVHYKKEGGSEMTYPPDTLTVHYKDSGSEMTYPPDAVSSTLPATDRQANINGTFNPATLYIVWLTVYESQVLSHTTLMFEQQPLLAGRFLVLVGLLPSCVVHLRFTECECFTLAAVVLMIVILSLLWSEFFETNATFRSASTDLGHALVVCDLTQIVVVMCCRYFECVGHSWCCAGRSDVDVL